MRIVIFAAVCALPLAGCNQQQTAQLQQAASAAIGEAHQGLDAASAPLGQWKQQASAALGAAKQAVDSAAALNPEWKQQLDQLKQQASAAKGALKPSP
ncbi:hypothetical protein [Chromobacterium paludis]|uniref:Uncharacterized protein n=1 Tax=Chromobacterium paludis TaxID=2605945 RepID=A0A5C1DK92_9NEIS|nr:hypothetical protein [Chromobacterium paludis]QEL57176.1 hypothetical protein FYK34_17220 [Chromobacterium paludis]